MAYTKITDFAAKDALLSGNPSKIVRGTEIDDEFNAIATADFLNVKGPSSATDNAVVRFDSTTGKLTQNSAVTVSDDGSLNITSSGARITGDFSNATVANRVMFQSTGGTFSSVGVLPPSGNTTAGFLACNSTVPEQHIAMYATATSAQIQSNTYGATYLPMTFHTGGAERMRIDTSGNVGIGATTVQSLLHIKTAGTSASPVAGIMWSFGATGDYRSSIDTAFSGGNAPQNSITVKVSDGTTTGQTSVMRFSGDGNSLHITPNGGLGYGTGAGGTVNQPTTPSVLKSNSVTLNKPTGQITMNNASLAAATIVSFTLTNTLIAAADVLIVNVNNGAGSPTGYSVHAHPQAGSAVISVKNETAGALAEAIVINFAIIKGATS